MTLDESKRRLPKTISASNKMGTATKKIRVGLMCRENTRSISAKFPRQMTTAQAMMEIDAA